MPDWPKFGDPVENTMASRENPTRVGFFVREVRRTGRVINVGTFWECTDGKGEFWLTSPANCIDPRSADETGRRPNPNPSPSEPPRA